MRRIQDTNVGPGNTFISRISATNTPGTKIRRDHKNDLQEEICRAIESTGEDVDTTLYSAGDGNRDQLAQMTAHYAAGGAVSYDEEATSAIDAYVIKPVNLGIRKRQTSPTLFENQHLEFFTNFKNAGASTIDVSLLLGEVLGTTILNIKLAGGAVDPSAGMMNLNVKIKLTYRTSPSAHLELDQSGQLNMVVLSSSTTYIPPIGVKSLEFTVTGGGGGGGGCDGGGAGFCAASSGGGGGGTSILRTNNVEASYAITIGAKGIGGAGLAGANGTSGGDSSVISSILNMIGGGGTFGVGLTQTNASTLQPGGIGGAASGGELDLRGPDGGSAVINEGHLGSAAYGGASFFGGATHGVRNGTGRDGRAKGSGGGGTAADQVATNYSGGNGIDGVVVIKEFF